jgi:hypothetical protein
MDDAQAALLLARNCSGLCNVACSTRTVPPLAHSRALGEFAGLIKDSVTQISGPT